MKLMTRFSLSHSGMVILTLLISFFFIYEGARLLYQRQARLSQEQQISDLALAAKESLVQHEDVAVLNFMKSVVRNPMVVYASYSNFSSGTHTVFPQTLDKELLADWQKTRPKEPSVGDSVNPYLFRLTNGMDIVEWSSTPRVEGHAAGMVRLGFSKAALEKDLGDQTARWTQLEMEAGAVA